MYLLFRKDHENTMTLLTFVIDDETADQFKQLAQDKGYYYTELLRVIVKDYVNNNK
jgi:hypothetical protein